MSGSTTMTMNGVFGAETPGNHAPKRSNSGREIVYIQQNRLLGSGQPVQDTFIAQQPLPVGSSVIPEDVLQIFNSVFRKYSYRDLHHWLKLDRQAGSYHQEICYLYPGD